MKILSLITITLIFIAPLTSSGQKEKDLAAGSMLDRLNGNWLLKGTIAGKNIEHDIKAEWVLGNQYIELKETSREKLADGKPYYDAIVFICYNSTQHRYDCLWLDNTATTDFDPKVIAHAPFKTNSIALLFQFGSKSFFHTTFTYTPNLDSWHWKLESDENGKTELFADATMTKE